MCNDRLRKDFVLAVERGDRRTAHRLARRLYRAAPPQERERWRHWRRATRRGHRVKISAMPVELLIGGDLAAMSELRAARTPVDLVGEEA